jgi:hypothetical protein
MNPLFFSSHALAPQSLSPIDAQLTSHAQFDIQNVTITNPTWERT